MGGLTEETLDPVAPGALARVGSWWAAYDRVLAESGMSSTSREVIDADAEYIVKRCVFGAGDAGDERWPTSRQRNGVVMGAVQSGKTASMMAVAAKALDAHVDAIVILAGTRRALWLQTLERLAAQLDTMDNPTQRRELMPSLRAVEAQGFSRGPVALYSMTPQKAQRLVEKRRPLIAVVMKNTAHLEHMGRSLREVLYPAVALAGRPFHLLVIDDEADDSSIGDARGLAASSDGSAQERQVPLRITDLWRGRHSIGGTVNEHVFATYVAYTATPQANFLQESSNPLAPRDFVVSLRTPGAEGNVEQRSSSYRVPEGLKAWYTGGAVYYDKFAEVPLCRGIDPAEVPESEQIADALRSFLVASAIRVLRSGGRFGPFTSRGRTFPSRTDAKSSTVAPMSMLVHPSSDLGGHFDTAARILRWSSSGEAESAELPPAGDRHLRIDGVVSDMELNEGRWVAWLADYVRAASVVAGVGELSEPPAVPEVEQWPLVRACILNEVVPGTNVAVINSDPDADDRPRYDPVAIEGGWGPAPNLSTIFVSGNVMSRGLTLEGLTTTLFTRTSTSPLADTQMQMQRWFGYRGGYIELCRVFASAEQLELFTSYHVNDEALRREVIAAMAAPDAPVPDITVLQGHHFKATGKVANLRGVPLNPGPRPFVRYMNAAGSDAHNLEMVAGIFRSGTTRVPNGTARQGLLSDRLFSALEVAEILERMRFVEYGPGSTGLEAARWVSAARHARIDDADPALPLYRAPAIAGSRPIRSVSPYDIAAYLRFWDAVSIRDVPSLKVFGMRPVAWNLVPLATRAAGVPTFRVGLRFGSGAPVSSGPMSRLGIEVRPMSRDVNSDTGELAATWGARNITEAGIVGDEFFDFRARGLQPSADDLDGRVAGSEGLMLFHLIDRGGDLQSIAVGLSIPLGGPDHVEARVER